MDTRLNPATLVPVKPAFRPDIAALRALAVIAVVLFHFGVTALSGGFVGVDVFFVISGFLMTSILTGAAARGRLDVVGFYLGRVRRIVPALVVVTLCTLAAGSLLLLPDPYKQLAWDAMASDTFTINLVFARTNDYFAQHADQSWLLHCWSLAVEIQFYVFIPFVVVGSMRFAPRRGVPIGLLLIAALSLGASYLQTRMDAASAFYLPTTRAWEFAAGGLVSTLPSLADRRRLVAAAGLAMILAAVIGYDPSMAYPGLWPLAPVIGTALIIWAQVESRLVSASPVRYLGDISYSVYLWHWPVLMVCNGLLPAGGPIAFAVEVAVTLALSTFTYHYVETPFRTRGRDAGWMPLASIAAGLCGVGLASWAVVALAGLPARVPADIRRVISVTLPEREWRSGTCFLRADQSFADLAPDCLAKADDPRPRILLWGDSTVADLYPGLMAQPWAKDFSIEQATAGSCAHYGSPRVASLPHCKELQDAILSEVLRDKPKYVFISMSRNNYTPQFDPVSVSMKETTIDPMISLIRELKSAGIGDVIVLGPVPFWPGGMPATVARESFAAKSLQKTLRLNAVDKLRLWDITVRDAAIHAGAKYLSFVDTLCHDNRCASLVPGASAPSLLQFDTMHFTTRGSAYVANYLIGPLIGEKISANDIVEAADFDPMVSAASGESHPAAPSSALPQHYPLTLGSSFKIDVDLEVAVTQVPYATILQTYDSDMNGFSIEYTAPNQATVYVRLEDRTLYASLFDISPGTAHHFEMTSQDGYPELTLDGKIVGQETNKRMTQSLGDLWVGGSGVFKGRDLDAKLTGLGISGDVVKQ